MTKPISSLKITRAAVGPSTSSYGKRIAILVSVEATRHFLSGNPSRLKISVPPTARAPDLKVSDPETVVVHHQ
jgi:hypothetical protein